MTTKNAQRRDRFTRIGEAIQSIYTEAAWRDRQGRHDFEMRPRPSQDRNLSSPSAGGPVLKTIQYESTVRGIRGMGLIIDRLTEWQQAEQSLRLEQALRLELRRRPPA